MTFRHICLLIWLALDLSQAGPSQPAALVNLPVKSRAEIIATAKRLSEHSWTSRADNLKASCIKNYDTDWQPNQRVIGLPYKWGGIDSPEQFDQKLAKGFAAGAHSRHGVTSCTAGIDCSGFVCYCWGLRSHKYTTGTLRAIAGKPKYNWFTDMKPGDALNKPGSHVVLFAGYHPDGTIDVYEASGSAARVVFHRTTWSRFKGYVPLQYKLIADEQ